MYYSKKRKVYLPLEVYRDGKHYIWSEDLQCYCAIMNVGENNYISMKEFEKSVDFFLIF